MTTSLSVWELWNAREDNWSLPASLSFNEQEWEVSTVGKLHLYRKSTGFLLKGTIDYSITLPCDYCGEPILKTLTLAVNERFVLDRYMEGDLIKEREISEDDFFEVLESKGQLNLLEILRQLLITEFRPPYLCEREVCFPEAADLQSGLVDEDTAHSDFTP